MQTTSISVQAATELSVAIFVSLGMSANDAEMAVWPLLEAEMMGITTHGLNRVPIYAKRLQLGGLDPRATVNVDRRTPALALIDGGNATGTVVASCALDTGLEMVAETGIAYVGCRHSNHCGALIPYGLKSCDAGYVLLAGTNASTSMPPWGGNEVRIGNNPLCVAAPIGPGSHFLLDMAMSVAARGKIRAARAAGQTIPTGWAVDKQGRPTNDPVAALEGFLAPMGGHKGSGLSLAVDILSGVMNGAKFLTGVPSWMENPEIPSELGHFFILIDPARLVGKEVYDQSMGDFRDLILNTAAADSTQPVRLPGQAEQQQRVQAIKNGLSIPRILIEEISELGRGVTSV